MDIRGWNERYRTRERSAEDLYAPPTPLVVKFAEKLRPGKALDLACGTGRNSVWLAGNGWEVSAVDGSEAAIDTLQSRAEASQLSINASVADLQQHEFSVQSGSFDLVLICYYLQRDLFEPAKAALKPGGSLIAIVHTTEGGEQPTASRLRPGELKGFFLDWEILHFYEGKPADPAHKRAVAEIVARRPG